MSPIIKWTLWQRRWSIMGWSLGVAGLIFLNLIFYPTFKDQAAELQKSFDNLPAAAVQLFGGSTDFFSPVGFLNSQIFFLLLPMLIGILAISIGSSLIAREEQDGTIESLLARPVSRTRLLGAKAMAGTLMLAGVSVWAFAVTAGIGWLVDLGIPIKNIALASLNCFLLVLSFGAVAFLLTAFGKARIASVGVAATLALGGYLVSSLAGTISWLDVPSKVFAFHYYQSEAILRGTYDWSHAWFFAALVAICALLSWLSFRRRDIG